MVCRESSCRCCPHTSRSKSYTKESVSGCRSQSFSLESLCRNGEDRLRVFQFFASEGRHRLRHKRNGLRELRRDNTLTAPAQDCRGTSRSPGLLQVARLFLDTS